MYSKSFNKNEQEFWFVNILGAAFFFKDFPLNAFLVLSAVICSLSIISTFLSFFLRSFYRFVFFFHILVITLFFFFVLFFFSFFFFLFFYQLDACFCIYPILSLFIVSFFSFFLFSLFFFLFSPYSSSSSFSKGPRMYDTEYIKLEGVIHCRNSGTVNNYVNNVFVWQSLSSSKRKISCTFFRFIIPKCNPPEVTFMRFPGSARAVYCDPCSCVILMSDCLHVEWYSIVLYYRVSSPISPWLQ